MLKKRKETMQKDDVAMEQLLNLVKTNDSIDKTSVLSLVNEMKNRKYLSNHQYEIWKGEDGYYNTYLPTSDGKRIRKRRKDKTELEELIIDYYKQIEENPTIEKIFYEWLDYRLMRGAIEKSTYTKYNTDFKRCFNDFGKRKICEITEMDIEEFTLDCVHRKKMNRKAFSNLRILLYGIFKYAKKKNLTDIDIQKTISDIDFCPKDFTERTIKAEEQVFMKKEEERILSYLKENSDDIVNLGLLLIFKTGMRIGELCVLRRQDIVKEKVFIHATETKYIDKEGKAHYDVKESPKTNAGIREISIQDNHLWILKKIKEKNPFGEFLFMENGERIKSYTFRNRLYSVCEITKVKKRGLHKIRKTYGSKLYDSDLTKAAVAKLMGHTDISVLEKSYYYNLMDDDEIRDAINHIVGL